MHCLPPEYEIDVAAARAQLQALADKEPEALIALTLAQIGDDGVEGEADLRLSAPDASAFLETLGSDQRVPGRALFLVRVTRVKDPVIMPT